MAITDAIVADMSFLINITVVLLKVPLREAKLGAGRRKRGIQMFQIRYPNVVTGQQWGIEHTPHAEMLSANAPAL
jgi:hypothetical protein